MELHDLAQQMHDTARAKGFWEDGYNDLVYSQKLALIHSEVTEVLEAIRKRMGGAAISEEIVDILIRTLDLYAGLYRMGETRQIVDDVLQYKMDKNNGRPHKHNNKF